MAEQITGIELIKKERQEQIQKHGFDQKHDSLHVDKSLIDAATYLLTNCGSYFPISWSLDWKNRFDKKSEIECLVVAGALIAAEIDRRLAQEGHNG